MEYKRLEGSLWNDLEGAWVLLFVWDLILSGIIPLLMCELICVLSGLIRVSWLFVSCK